LSNFSGEVKMKGFRGFAIYACACVGASMFSSAAGADEIKRLNWLPNYGFEGEAGEDQGSEFLQRPLGDMWTFKCPKGGRFSVRVDTYDDRDEGSLSGIGSNIDPFLFVVDGGGNLVVSANNDFRCEHTPTCQPEGAPSGLCPEVVDMECGVGNQHGLVIHDVGTTFGIFPDPPCIGGGGYQVFLTVFDARGRELSEKSVKFGGGPSRKLPRWVRDFSHVGATGPLLDDEAVPDLLFDSPLRPQ
jgi:hypothetical protein